MTTQSTILKDATASNTITLENADGVFSVKKGEGSTNTLLSVAGNTVSSALGALALASQLGLRSKLLGISRDTSLASGTQALTGVGFQPSCVIAIANEGSITVKEGSVGFADSSKSGGCMFWIGDNTGLSYSNALLYAYQSTGNTYVGNVSSYDADGITLSWTKLGAPTGTLTGFLLLLG